jgi:hypothetical protein
MAWLKSRDLTGDDEVSSAQVIKEIHLKPRNDLAWGKGL